LSHGFIFQIVERHGEYGRHVLYQSDKLMPAGVFEHNDASIPLLDQTAHNSGMPTMEPLEENAAAINTGTGIVAGSSPGPILISFFGTPHWKVAIRHRSGSVDAAVNSLRRRNLAVSMVVLLMLLFSLITILVATRRARRLARLQMEFASGISHELRTPLAVIRSAAENLEDGVVTEEGRVRHYGSLIHKESQRLAEMVDHILDFAQLHAERHRYRIEGVPVMEIVKSVLSSEQPLIESSGVTVSVEIPTGLPLLLTDASVLQQCLQNLLSNAIKYGAGGGKILVTAAAIEEDSTDRILISVRDFGAGIAHEDLAHIYEPFYRTQSARDSQIRGTGLGLSLTRKMVESLGGKITVESALEKGTTFTLHLPAATDEYAQLLALNTSAPSRQASR
jgi:signal transduction histidine kinase